MNNIVVKLRPVDRKRLDHLQERTENPLTSENIGYVHTILAQRAFGDSDIPQVTPL
jgi:hypothetical protein